MDRNSGWSRTRPVIAGLHGAVASAHPLASQAGLDQLRSGGNAVDAVVAMAAALGVVEPYMSGPAGVGLMLLHLADGETHVLNFTGSTPAAGTPDQFTPASQDLGPRACMIPGNVAGWFEALRRFGSRTAGDVLSAAHLHAAEGFPLHPANVHFIGVGRSRLNPAGSRIFEQVPLACGAVLRQSDLGRSLGRLIEHGPDDFYTGQISRAMADDVQRHDGLLTREDLAGYQPRWEQPLEIEWRGVRIRTCPPNCEGFQILQTLRLLEEYDLAALGHNSADYLHLLTEAVKLAAADRIAYCGDPDFVTVPVDRLLSDEYLAGRRQLINHETASVSEGERWRGPREAAAVSPGRFPGLTTHLSAVDRQGNVASITQSLGNGFGSGFYVAETGIVLNNFAWWTEIDPVCDTPNLIAPGKRWSCCMSPVQVFHPDGRFWFSMATPGSEGILHTTVQMLLNVLVFGADVQAALEAPRVRVWEGTRLQIEERVPAPVREELTRRGHQLELVGDWSPFVGGGQAVMIDADSGSRLAGADPRRDGYALAW
ncbi:MAG: gamma-glutamyltransferase family protein [Planctomycetaceae bacterium]|nr:gamma-glutamyltransferase family protein [Planctomycetaceae bacterium]